MLEDREDKIGASGSEGGRWDWLHRIGNSSGETGGRNDGSGRIEDSEQLAGARRTLETLRERGREVVTDPTGTALDALRASRESRKRIEEENKSKGWLNRIIGKGLRRVVMGSALELTPIPPVPLTPWILPGDWLAIFSGVTGRDLLAFSGDKIDWIDRALYIAAGVIPIAPAGILVTAGHKLRHKSEDTAHALRTVSPKK